MNQPKGPTVTELLPIPFPSEKMGQRFLELAQHQLEWEKWRKDITRTSQPLEQRFEQRVGISGPFNRVAGIQTAIGAEVLTALGCGILRPDWTEEEWIAFLSVNLIGVTASSIAAIGIMYSRIRELLPEFFKYGD